MFRWVGKSINYFTNKQFFKSLSISLIRSNLYNIFFSMSEIN
jgi:hypothetical protein